MNGGYGDVVVSLSAADLSGAYRPGPATGWAAIGSDANAVLAALLRLVGLLAYKGILTGTEPYDIFNNARAAHAR
jgi:hypothetical protein